MINPPLIAVGNTGMQIYRHTTFASVEEESGMDLGFERKLTKVILNSLAFSGQMTSDQLKGKEYDAKSPVLEFRRTTFSSLDL